MIDLDSVNNLNSSSARISIIRVASKYPSLQDEIMAGLLLISDMNELNKDYQTIFKDLNAEQLKEVNSLVDSVVSIKNQICLLYTSPSPRDQRGSRMPSSA